MRREHNNRVSFFDPANQIALDRLVAGDWGSEEDAEGAEETAEKTMISVEEMLEGYEWASDDILGRKSVKGAADLVEARLLDELMALEKVCYLTFDRLSSTSNSLVRLTYTLSWNPMIGLTSSSNTWTRLLARSMP